LSLSIGHFLWNL